MKRLRAQVGDRLAELAAGRPELGKALTLQRSLLDRQIDLLELIVEGGLPGVRLPPGYLSAKLRRGIPALHGEPIPLPSRLLELSAGDFCERLAEGGAGEAALAVAQALRKGGLDSAELVSACFGRDQRRVRAMAVRESVSPDLAWLVAELAAAPFAHLLQAAAFVPGNAAIADALGAWDRGFCPACGSWPAVVEVVGGRHTLRCSFCAAGWELSSYRCLYCANDADTFATVAPDLERAGRRVQACGGCGSYIKSLDVSAPAVFPLVAIDDLASMDLDLVAIERGYARPPLPDIRKLP